MPVQLPDAAARLAPLPEPVGDAAQWLALGAQLLAAAGEAVSLAQALPGAANLLQQGLAAVRVQPFRVSGVTRTHIVVSAPGGAGTTPAIPEHLPLDGPEALALSSGLNHVSPGGSFLRLAVRRDGQPVAGLAMHGPPGTFDMPAIRCLMEIVRLALNQCAQREPNQNAALGLPALSREFAEVLDDNLFISNPERTHFEFLTGSTLDTWGISREQFALRPESLGDLVVDEDRPLLAQRRQRERACEPCDVSFRIRHPARGLRCGRTDRHLHSRSTE